MISPASVSSPMGELDRAVLFPDSTQTEFEARLSGYIADAVGRASNASDEAQTAWVYHRAYHAAYLQRVASPHRVDLEEGGSYSYLVSQIQGLKNLADQWETRFNELIVVMPTFTIEMVGGGTVENVFVP